MTAFRISDNMMNSSFTADTERSTLSVEEAAGLAGVSTATIRNWGKTGYLTRMEHGLICRDSMNAFMTEVAGKVKLIGRANKSLKDRHNHLEITNSLSSLIHDHQDALIGEAYVSSLSDAHRNREGIYYTPPEIVSDMLEGIIVEPDTIFLDPCCGTGNFLVEALKKGVKPENLYGFDSDANAVKIAKSRIAREFGAEADHLQVGDFLILAEKLAAQGKKFDLVFTNPPWGKKLPKHHRTRYAGLYGSGRSSDTSAIFLFAALKLVKPGGMLGFLLQEAFFNIANFEDARKQLSDRQIVSLTDYGRPFKKLLTKAQAIVIRNAPAHNSEPVSCNSGNKTYYRQQASFQANPGCIFNFWADPGDAAIIDLFYSKPHITLRNNARWALGIVTGDNGGVCSDKALEGHVPVYRGADIGFGGLKEPSIYIPADFSRFQQVAPPGLYQAREKLIYRFISNRLCFYHDTRQRYILNSANLLIPDENIGISCRQLADLLNSESINWLFRKLFRTHKILRRDLESLPIHLEYFRDHPVFIESSYMKYLGLKAKENHWSLKKHRF
jgi:site-specific DNA-methyltransferase (adenine-specific)